VADAIVATQARSAAAQSGFAATIALAALSRHTSCVTLTVLAAVLAAQVRITRSRADGVLLEQPIAAACVSTAWRCEKLFESVAQYEHVSRERAAMPGGAIRPGAQTRAPRKNNASVL
jgi:chaperone required for assembly of F1-ATPase